MAMARDGLPVNDFIMTIQDASGTPLRAEFSIMQFDMPDPPRVVLVHLIISAEPVDGRPRPQSSSDHPPKLKQPPLDN